jgi:hypothetical protein
MALNLAFSHCLQCELNPSCRDRFRWKKEKSLHSAHLEQVFVCMADGRHINAQRSTSMTEAMATGIIDYLTA